MSTFDQLRENFPAALRDLPQWACASGKPGEKGPDKSPRNPKTGYAASSTNPKTWGTLEQAISMAENKGWKHVGFMLTAGDPYCIVDLDNKEHKPASPDEIKFFNELVDDFGSYAERSASGRGMHIVVEASIAKGEHKGNVEVYDRARFMICTGDVLLPKPVAQRQGLIDELIARVSGRKSKAKKDLRQLATSADVVDDLSVARLAASAGTGDKFNALMEGDYASCDYPSESEGRFALIAMLARYSADDAQVLRILDLSPLGQSANAARLAASELTKIREATQDEADDESAVSLFSDKANGQRIAHFMRDRLMYAPGIGWHVWDGARWHADTLEARRHAMGLGRIVMNEAIDTLRNAASAASDRDAERERDVAERLTKFAGMVENIPKINAAMTAAEPLLRRDADALDADPWALGCTNGILNLRTGELRPSDPEQLITKSTGIDYDPAATCPAWDRFLARIFKPHPELIVFMQGLAGYWLTGLTDPPYLAILYGVGANGKSTLVNAISHAMGEYATTAPPGLLMIKYGQTHPTELAFLQGQRFVVSPESPEGGRLDEEKIKALTGSDKITARHMRQDFYKFNPTHKLALMTNYKPIVRNTDQGIWRRLLMLNFEEVIPLHERDPGLADQLRREAPGILRWAAEGAQRFYKNGRKLPLPSVVAEATDEYRTESDVLGEFLAEVCIEGAAHSIFSADLYALYVAWCEDNGERAMASRTLGLRLKERGLEPGKNRSGQRLWKGIGVQVANNATGRRKHQP